MPNETLNKEIAEFLVGLNLNLTLGTNLFYGAPDKASVNTLAGRPVIVYVTPATFPPNMQRLVDINETGETYNSPTPGNLITEGLPGIQEVEERAVIKARILPRVQIMGWGSDPGAVKAMMENINNRLNQFTQDPAAPLIPGGKWDIEFMETDGDPELVDFEALEIVASQVRIKVSGFRRF